jgi:hypothetical protein
MILMGNMVLSEPSNIIIWTYQDMMKLMSKIFDGDEMAGADEDFGSGSWANVAEFCPKPKPQIHSA